MDTRPALTPWLASLFVAPDARTGGIGTQLIARIEREAARLGFAQLHLITFDRDAYYAKRGWTDSERTLYRDTPVVVMSKLIPPSPGNPE